MSLFQANLAFKVTREKEISALPYINKITIEINNDVVLKAPIDRASIVNNNGIQ
jgi:hypothetical protein